MKHDAIDRLSPDVNDDVFQLEKVETDEGSLKRLVNLQSELFDLVVNSGVGEEPLNLVAENIRNSFLADGTIIVSVAGKKGGKSEKYACSTAGVEQAIIDQFITTEKPIPSLGRIESDKIVDCSADVQSKGTFWAEAINEAEDCTSQATIVLLFDEERERTSKDSLALKAISPLVRLVSDAAGSEDALKSANNRFASLASTIPGVVYQRIVKPDGDIQYSYISETAQDLFGVSAEEILSNPRALFGTYAPEYANSFREKLIEASKNLSVWDVEASIVTKDGQTKYTHAIAHPQKLDDGSVLWTGVILDATRIKKAELAVAETEARTRNAIVESLSQGFLLFDSDDRLVLRNSHFSKLYPDLNDVAVPGASYSDVLSAELSAGLDAAQCSRSLKSRISERMKKREAAKGFLIERQLSEDCWIMINEHRTPDGGTVVLHTDVSEIKRREQRIQHMAHHDALTGLPNRVLFHSRIKEAVDQAQRYGTQVAVACLDLDHFKNVNDTLGHPAGDALLCTVAKRIRRQIRETDIVARLGGDEFAVILTEFEDAEFVHHVAERILKTLARPIDVDGQETITGASIGIALLSDEAKEPDRLLKNADLALYRAKSEGRNKYRFFEPEMDEIALARRKIELDLRLAIEKEELQLYFQPLINVAENKIAGFEALIRWKHPEWGLVSPDEFIHIAEETGLIVSVGEWVLESACAAAVKWSEPAKIAVNISPVQFRQAQLVEFVSEVLQKTSLDPSRLELEITESVLMHNTEEAMETLYRLKGLGVRIAMDDFGTGYSSLGNLRSFPFDKIKIDRSFVSDLESNAEAAAIVRAVVGLGKSLGIDTTAEGVETRDQLVYLRIEGCSEVQGFYYSKPRPGNEVNQLLKIGPAGMELSGSKAS